MLISTMPTTVNEALISLLRPCSTRTGRCEWQQHSSEKPWALRRDNDSFVFEVRPGDKWSRESSSNPAERSELAHLYRWPIGKDIWFAFSMTVQSGLPSIANWTVVGQLHHSPNIGDGRGSPPFAQYIFPGKTFVIAIRHSNEIPLRTNPPIKILFSDNNIRLNHTYTFIYRLRYSYVDGALDAWRDGRKIVRYRGPLGYPASVGPYLKFGIYRERSANRIKIRYDGIRMGESLIRMENISPLILEPDS